MQTFLPYADFKTSAESLDYRRLGKQRVEAMQILKAILGIPRKDGKPYKGWLNHPCSVMWKAYPEALKHYSNIMIEEWKHRGYNNNMDLYEVDVNNIEMPWWIGEDKIHKSHRSNLLRKDFEYYSALGWTENPEDPYVWHDVEGKLYEQHVGTGTRVYI